MTLSAFDCLRRGCVNLGANWELVLVNIAGNCVVTFLFVAGFLPPVLVVGFEIFRNLIESEAMSGFERFFAELARRIAENPGPLLLAMVAGLAVWLLAMAVFCFVQAGTFGVLIAGERQALPGVPRDRRWFRTFSLHNFSGWGGRYLWRFAIFYALVGLFLIGLLVLALLLVFATALGAERWGPGAAFGIGCGGALPFLFLALLLSAWSRTAQADLAREGSGVAQAAKTALEVIGRRLGAVILLFVLFIIAAIALALAFLPFSIAFEAAFSDRPLASALASLSMTGLQWVPAALLNLALAGALAALVRSETSRSAGPA